MTERQEQRTRLRRDAIEQRQCGFQMRARVIGQLIERGAQFWILLAREDFFHSAAMALQQLHRHEQLTPRRIQRQRRHHLRDALGKAGMAREVFDLVGCFAANSGRPAKTTPTRCRRCSLPAPPWSASGRCRDRTGAPRSGATAARPAGAHSRIANCNSAATGLPSTPPCAFARQHVGPPLQPHLARQCLTDMEADPRNLDIEGIERQERPALVGGDEQRRGVADEVVAADEVGAKCGRILAGCGQNPRVRVQDEPHTRRDIDELGSGQTDLVTPGGPGVEASHVMVAERRQRPRGVSGTVGRTCERRRRRCPAPRGVRSARRCGARGTAAG